MGLLTEQEFRDNYFPENPMPSIIEPEMWDAMIRIYENEDFDGEYCESPCKIGNLEFEWSLDAQNDEDEWADIIGD